jgi:hypothetical protein
MFARLTSFSDIYCGMDRHGPVRALSVTIWEYPDMFWAQRDHEDAGMRSFRRSFAELGTTPDCPSPISPMSIFHVETLMRIPVFCLITPTTPSLSSGFTSRRTGTSSRCSAHLSYSCSSLLNQCVRVCSLSGIRNSSATVSRSMADRGRESSTDTVCRHWCT